MNKSSKIIVCLLLAIIFLNIIFMYEKYNSIGTYIISNNKHILLNPIKNYAIENNIIKINSICISNFGSKFSTNESFKSLIDYINPNQIDNLSDAYHLKYFFIFSLYLALIIIMYNIFKINEYNINKIKKNNIDIYKYAKLILIILLILSFILDLSINLQNLYTLNNLNYHLDETLYYYRVYLRDKLLIFFIVIIISNYLFRKLQKNKNLNTIL
jgi:hypothetical protein